MRGHPLAPSVRAAQLPDASDLYPPASFTMPTSSYPNIVRLLASEPDEAPEELPTEKP